MSNRLVWLWEFGMRSTFPINELTQICRDMNVNIYACFIDHRKVFGYLIYHLKDILRSTGIDNEDLRFIFNSVGSKQRKLWWKNPPKCSICKESRTIGMHTTISYEHIFREAWKAVTEGIKINGKIINYQISDMSMILLYTCR